MAAVGRTCALVAREPVTLSVPATEPGGAALRWSPGIRVEGNVATPSWGKADGSPSLTSTHPVGARPSAVGRHKSRRLREGVHSFLTVRAKRVVPSRRRSTACGT